MAILLGANSGLRRSTSTIDINQPYTAMVRIFLPSGTLTEGYMLSFWDSSFSSQDTAYLGFDSTNYRLVLATEINANFTSANGSILSRNSWLHIALVRESSTIVRAVLNGVTDATITANVSTRPNSGNLQYLGCLFANPTATESFRYDLSDYYLYDAALSNAEIANQMHFAYPLRTANLREWLPLNPNSTRNKDYSGNARDYTELGTVTNTESRSLVMPQLIYPKKYITPPPIYRASPSMLLAC